MGIIYAMGENEFEKILKENERLLDENIRLAAENAKSWGNKKNSFTTAVVDCVREAFPKIIPSPDAVIEFDTSEEGKKFNADEIYAIFFVNSDSSVESNIKRVFVKGRDVILKDDKKSEYSTLVLKDVAPEDIILGRLVKVNGKAV